MWKFLLIYLVANAKIINGANILAIFPVPTLWHQKVYRTLTEALEDRGHKLTIISTDPQLGRDHRNTTEIDMHFSHELLKKAIFSMSTKDVKTELDSLSEWYNFEFEILEKQFQSEDVQYLLRNSDEKFDAVIVEHVGHTPWYAFAEYFNAPLIGISATEVTLEFHEAMGNNANPIRDPDVLLPTTNQLTFQERFNAWHFYIFYNFYYKMKFHTKFDELIRKFMPNIKSSSQELKEKTDLLLINTHPAMQYVRPMVPTTIQLGFMHVNPPKEIEDGALKTFLDQSDKSIIYMSFGSAIKSSDLQEPFLRTFKNVFKSLPYNVIWIWEKDEMPDKPDNVFITHWVPQADLLAHPKIKLFITHGGQLSVEESIDRGVPMVVIPFFGDQGANGIRIQNLNVGVLLNIQFIDEKNLRQAIDEALHGHCKENVLNLQSFIRDEPMRPVDKAVWWVEYVIKHNGTKHLQYNGKNVPFWTKYMLDFVLIGIIVLHCIVWIIKLLLAAVFERIKDRIMERIKRKNENPIAKKIKKKKKEN